MINRGIKAMPNACGACPWRLANQGKKPDPHSFYTRGNLKRLWTGLRTGNAPGMSCHPTDPRMAEFEGYEKTAEREELFECAGSLVLVMHEMKLFEEVCLEVDAETKAGTKLPRGEALKRFKQRGGRFNRAALSGWTWRLMTQGSKTVMDDPEVGYTP